MIIVVSTPFHNPHCILPMYSLYQHTIHPCWCNPSCITVENYVWLPSIYRIRLRFWVRSCPTIWTKYPMRPGPITTTVKHTMAPMCLRPSRITVINRSTSTIYWVGLRKRICKRSISGARWFGPRIETRPVMVWSTGLKYLPATWDTKETWQGEQNLNEELLRIYISKNLHISIFCY